VTEVLHREPLKCSSFTLGFDACVFECDLASLWQLGLAPAKELEDPGRAGALVCGYESLLGLDFLQSASPPGILSSAERAAPRRPLGFRAGLVSNEVS
jgi:hypothetical protein